MESSDDNLCLASDAEDNMAVEKVEEIIDDGNEDVNDNDNEDEGNDDGDKAEETETKGDEEGTKADETKEEMEVDDADAKKEAAGTNWVDVIENENNTKLLSELNKIGKLVSIDDKRSEINEMVRKHKVLVYPLSPEDLADAFIVDVMRKCPNSHIHFRSVVDAEGTPKLAGLLELTFGKLSDLQQHSEQLSQFREDIKVSHSAASSDYRKFMQEWRAAAKLPENPRNDRLSLYAPSLPESVTEEEMWELFPKAHEIWLVPGTPRQHAYISFCSEEMMSETMVALRGRGPPRSDFNFCRLIRFSKIMEIVREERAGKRPGGRGGLRGGSGADSLGRRRPVRRVPRRRPPNNKDNKTDSDKEKGGDEKKNGTTEGDKSTRPRGSGNNGPDKSKKDWYSKTRTAHLDRLRTQRRNEPRNRNRNPRRPPRDSPRRPPRDMSPRPRANRPTGNQGLQMLDNLLSALGQASGPGRAMNQNQPRRDAFQPRRSPSPRNRRQRNRRGRGRRGGMGDNQTRTNDGPGLGASPGKRTHSTEDLFRPRDGKRQRQDSFRNRNTSRDEDYRQNTSQDIRGEYRTPPSRNSGGQYRPDNRDHGRIDFDERRSDRSKPPVGNLSMLSALTSLARRVRQNPSGQDPGYSGQMGAGSSWSGSRRDNFY